MFNINEAATIYVYMEYIIPIAIIVLIIGYSITSHYFLKFKIWRINREHTVERQYNSTYWYEYRCTKCGKLLYKQPSSVNTSLSKDAYIFRYTGKCN